MFLAGAGDSGNSCFGNPNRIAALLVNMHENPAHTIDRPGIKYTASICKEAIEYVHVYLKR